MTFMNAFTSLREAKVTYGHLPVFIHYTIKDTISQNLYVLYIQAIHLTYTQIQAPQSSPCSHSTQSKTTCQHNIHRKNIDNEEEYA